MTNGQQLDLLAIAGAYARVLAFVHVAPGFADAGVPERVRLALAFVLAVVLAPLGGVALPSLPARLVAEALCGLLLGLAAAMPWSTVTAALGPVASAAGLDEGDDPDESAGARLAAAVGIAAFLGLAGDRFLVRLLASPRLVALDSSGLGDLAMRAGAGLFTLAGEALLPFLFVLAVARLAAAVVNRAAALDLSPLLAPALLAVGLIVMGGFFDAAPGLYSDALDRAAELVRAPPAARGPVPAREERPR